MQNKSQIVPSTHWITLFNLFIDAEQFYKAENVYNNKIKSISPINIHIIMLKFYVKEKPKEALNLFNWLKEKGIISKGIVSKKVIVNKNDCTVYNIILKMHVDNKEFKMIEELYRQIMILSISNKETNEIIKTYFHQSPEEAFKLYQNRGEPSELYPYVLEYYANKNDFEIAEELYKKMENLNLNTMSTDDVMINMRAQQKKLSENQSISSPSTGQLNANAPEFKPGSALNIHAKEFVPGSGLNVNFPEWNPYESNRKKTNSINFFQESGETKTSRQTTEKEENITPYTPWNNNI